MQSLLFFIIALAILIAIHEYGHFWVARRCGVKVLKFSIGFGKPIWQRQGRDGTQYIIAAIPLGGYVKMLDEREGEVPDALKQQAFNLKPLSSRVAIVAAGPIANLLFAILAYWVIFVSGVPGIKAVVDNVAPDSPAAAAGIVAGEQIQTINGKPTPTWSSVHSTLSYAADKGQKVELGLGSDLEQLSYKQLELPKVKLLTDKPKNILVETGLTPVMYPLQAILGDVLPNQAAAKAGLMKGDKLLSAEGQAITEWSAWVDIIRQNPEKPLLVVIERTGEQLELVLTPETAEQGHGVIGAMVDPEATTVPSSAMATMQYGVLAGLLKAISTTWQMSVLTVKGIGAMIMGELSTKNIGGPITIAQFAGASADKGITPFITFLALISISLGILNLLPIPVLDGGHLLLYFCEWLKGEPLSEAIQIQGQKVGIILLLSLMLFAFFNDLSRLFGL